jgi:hypothetical protein
VSDYNISLALATMQQHLTDMQANLTKPIAYLGELDRAEEAREAGAELFLVDDGGGVTVWYCIHDENISEHWYTVDPANNDIDDDDNSGTMFDVDEIITTVLPRTFKDHAEAIRFAIEAGWLTSDGLNLRPEVQ